MFGKRMLSLIYQIVYRMATYFNPFCVIFLLLKKVQKQNTHLLQKKRIGKRLFELTKSIFLSEYTLANLAIS